MITATSAANQAYQQQSGAQTQSSALTSDFETFLKMLTAQAQNQDPLEPLDSSEYASQLAQFSMVEQQVQTNDLLAQLTIAMGSVNLNELSSWVGMNVKTAAAFQFGSEPVQIFAQADPGADKAMLVVKDAAGDVIDRIPVDVTESEFTWAGVDGSGDPVPPGTYSASLESYKNEDLLSSSPASTYSLVVEAQVGDEGVLLTLNSGDVVTTGDVMAIRTDA